MKVKWILLSLLLWIIFSFPGCFGIYLDINEGVSFPTEKFNAAWDRIDWLSRHDPQRAGEVSKLCLMVYSGHDREFVSVGVPIWLLRKMDRNEHFEVNPAGERVSRYVELEKLKPNDLLRMGPGLIAQIDDDEKDDHILIWLE